MEEKDFEKKSTKKIGIIIAVIVVLLIAAAIGGIVYLNYTRKPEKIFAKAVEDIFEMPEKENAKSGKVELELSADIEANEPEIRAMNEFLKEIKLKSTTEIDVDKKILNENLTATYNGEQVISLDALVQNETMYLYLKDIYSKYIELNEEYLEGLNLSTIFETTTDTVSEDLLKDIKQIILDEMEKGKFTKEKVEVDGENIQKSTLRLTEKEVLEITLKILKKIYEYQPIAELAELIDDLEYEIEYLDNTKNYVDISIYTKGLTNKFVKADIVLVNVEDDELIVCELNKKAKNETEISFAINEESTKVSGATKLIEFTIKEENENKGTIAMKMNIEEGYSIALTIKYVVDYNAKIEARNTHNSIDINSLTEADAMEMYENIQKNEILYGIVEQLIMTIQTNSNLLEQANEAASAYEESNQTLEEQQQRVDELMNELETIENM